MWHPGNKLVHPFNPELGTGLVVEVSGRFLKVFFPAVGREITLAAEGAGLEPFVLPPGARARLIDSGDDVEIASWDDGSYTLSDGRVVEDAELWPIDAVNSPLESLAQLRLDRLGAVRNRLEGLRLIQLRESGGLGSLLGGRIELFPHQLHTALTALEHDPVRWLLADEVGLGKTVVASLILSSLVRTGRAERALVIAPETLTVQWLGELYRKFHQVFVLLDSERIESVTRDYEEDANAFDVHPYGVISTDLLASDPELRAQAHKVDLDLVVVDEAHGLTNPEFEAAVAPLVRRAKHALLLTATPLAADRMGFFRLLSLLHPDRFDSFEGFERMVDSGEAAFACTSAVRRADLGAWPPRRAIRIDLPPAMKDPKKDPRARWIADSAREWLEKREKVLVFVHETKTLEKLKKFLESETRTHVSVFHRELTTAQRDIEVARFREGNAPLLLVSEAATEGRNFQFCDRMVHYELPADPVLLEQRIGRLDRIGRTKDVEIVIFYCQKARPDLATLFERLDLYERPSAGLDLALGPISQAVETAARDGKALDIDALVARVEASREASPDVPRVFYTHAYDASQEEKILSLVPEDLELRTRRFSLGAANNLGIKIVEKGGEALYYLELGASLTVESLPGVPEGSRWLGTFDRTEAVDKEELDFYASGHPLVEGLLLELEDGQRGRTGLCEIPDAEETVAGLLCVYRDGPEWTPVVVDETGKHRPDLATKVVEGLSEAKPVDPGDWNIGPQWAETIRALGDRADRTFDDASPDLELALFFRLGTS
jgi:ATP-dependent helicase HepA